jgi:hypothetical protein
MLRVWAIALSFVMLPVCTSAKADLFAISKPQFSGFVLDDGMYTVVNPAINDEISRSNLDNGMLYFSFTLIGTDKTIQYLEDMGRLDIEAVIFAGGLRRDLIRIGITQQQWAKNRNNIIDKYNHDGFFSWRFYINTRKINFSSAEIMIRDAMHHVITRSTVNIVP